MRFFIQDPRQQTERLYESPSKKVTLYPGQRLSYGEFQQLHLLKGGLYSFRYFLSTNMDWDIAFTFAQDIRQDLRLSYYKVENEFLFTMHTVSRVGKIIQLELDLWQVQLSLQNDKDEDLQEKIENIL
ncbi:unnamed protein product [Rotaria magnacalcarata]|uniref:Uncharacterized protein n=1 Tax=Rotaria magnacalcarata TaxID=392030 RepID=A0A815U6V0_9BILA|nr:unnamed protein product [Rotaria magnacalcarata]CAF1677894.1 unnamed protein product [Rotaria magnacalcarata]CAF1997622.1 unnamed protein product [Rotaria magnacalcarata]CAF4667912.1 unnamed protein product [Rotaria magnacalcarata]CAF4670145.1 unnamed protein product [Rotaria magnacalcarata]